MIKNNKGFTLVEIVAVVALLGVVSTIVFPQVFKLVTQSRKKIYVQDAIRLIAKAQYAMNAKSNKIEKPDSGEAILFSMKYLAQDDFQSTPNGGTYLMDHSFVLVKRENGTYYYAVMLVEAVSKDDYRGISLSTEAALNGENGLDSVITFEKSQFAYIGDARQANSVQDNSSYNLSESQGKSDFISSIVQGNVRGVDSSDSGRWNSFVLTNSYVNP